MRAPLIFNEEKNGIKSKIFQNKIRWKVLTFDESMIFLLNNKLIYNGKMASATHGQKLNL